MRGYSNVLARFSIISGFTVGCVGGRVLLLWFGYGGFGLAEGVKVVVFVWLVKVTLWHFRL